MGILYLVLSLLRNKGTNEICLPKVVSNYVLGNSQERETLLLAEIWGI